MDCLFLFPTYICIILFPLTLLWFSTCQSYETFGYQSKWWMDKCKQSYLCNFFVYVHLLRSSQSIYSIFDEFQPSSLLFFSFFLVYQLLVANVFNIFCCRWPWLECLHRYVSFDQNFPLMRKSCLVKCYWGYVGYASFLEQTQWWKVHTEVWCSISGKRNWNGSARWTE